MDKILNYLGIARRSRYLVWGTDTTIRELQSNKLYLIILASDASLATKDKIIKKAYFYNVPVIEKFNVNEICSATGLKHAVMVGIDDLGLANAILDVNKNS